MHQILERNTSLKSPIPRIKRPHLHGIRTKNRSRILQLLREAGAISRQELAERLDLTPASLSRISKELIDQGICIEEATPRKDSRRGRPSVALQINAGGGYLVAISISSYARIISIIDITGNRRFEQEIPSEVLHSAADTIAFIGAYVDQLAVEKVVKKESIIGAALTIPGSINSQSGFLTKSVFLNWPEFPIKDNLVEAIGCHVSVENIGDALCLNFLDNCKSTMKTDSSIFLAHVSAGMGASIAIEGKIVRRLEDEGWINDIIVPNKHTRGEVKNKLSQLASGRAIIDAVSGIKGEKWKSASDFNEQLKCAVALANSGEETIRDEFFEAGRALGTNLVPLTIAYAPNTIVLAGPVLRAQSYFEGAKYGYHRAVEEMEIKPSQLVVSSASYVDAAESLALHDFFHSGAYGS